MNNWPKTNGEARRLIRNKGARLNDKIIPDENYVVTLKDLDENGYIKLSVGKYSHILINPLEIKNEKN